MKRMRAWDPQLADDGRMYPGNGGGVNGRGRENGRAKSPAPPPRSTLLPGFQGEFLQEYEPAANEAAQGHGEKKEVCDKPRGAVFDGHFLLHLHRIILKGRGKIPCQADGSHRLP